MLVSKMKPNPGASLNSSSTEVHALPVRLVRRSVSIIFAVCSAAVLEAGCSSTEGAKPNSQSPVMRVNRRVNDTGWDWYHAPEDPGRFDALESKIVQIVNRLDRH